MYMYGHLEYESSYNNDGAANSDNGIRYYTRSSYSCISDVVTADTAQCSGDTGVMLRQF